MGSRPFFSPPVLFLRRVAPALLRSPPVRPLLAQGGRRRRQAVQGSGQDAQAQGHTQEGQGREEEKQEGEAWLPTPVWGHFPVTPEPFSGPDLAPASARFRFRRGEPRALPPGRLEDRGPKNGGGAGGRGASQGIPQGQVMLMG